jgi:hypothetical protein
MKIIGACSGVLFAFVVAACSTAGEPTARTEQAATSQSCGEMGGTICSQSREHAINGHRYLGNSYDCVSCYGPAETRSCGEMGGTFCAQARWQWPDMYETIGSSADCADCLRPVGPSCREAGGELCCTEPGCFYQSQSENREAFRNTQPPYQNADTTWDCYYGCFGPPR